MDNNEVVSVSSSSPLNRQERLEGETTLRERDWVGKLNLRGNAADKSFAKKCAKVFDLDLPLTSNGLASNDKITIFWSAHDEWLIHCPIGELESYQQQLTKQLENSHYALTDLTDYYTVLNMAGPSALRALRAGSPYDFSPDKFKPGQCTQTRYGHASILVRCLEEQNYDIQIRWSYAEYLWEYLKQAIAADV